VFVAGDLLSYPVQGKPKIQTAPDTMVVFGRPTGYRGSYEQWEEGGIAPHVVFEIHSPGNRPPDMMQKFLFYQKYGVEEYYRYNPENGDLAGCRRGESGLEEIADIDGHTSARLGIRFQLGEGPDNLRIVGPAGVAFASFVEIIEQRESERRRADAEHIRADAEQQRAERLAAKLRELGVDPD
jgi:hypothetical protein